MFLLNVLMSVWGYLIELEAPGATPHGYADDAGVTSDTLPPANKAADLTTEYTTLTGRQLAPR